LASTIVEDLRIAFPSRHILYFYFNFGDQKKRGIRDMLLSLLAQLCEKIILESVEALYEGCQQGSREADEDEIMVALSEALKCAGTVYIIIDAFDECKDVDGIRELFLNDIADLYLLITSSKEIGIEQVLKKCYNDALRELQTDLLQVDADVKRLVQHRLDSEGKLWKFSKNAKLKGEIEDCLIKGSQGLYVSANATQSDMNRAHNT